MKRKDLTETKFYDDFKLKKNVGPHVLIQIYLRYLRIGK